MVTIAFTGGGTGGHIYPGLAVAARLRAILSCRIIWIGSADGMDRSIVEGAGLEFFAIPAGKLRRYFSLRTLPDAFKVLAGFFASRSILRREKPELLFSKGGYVSVPPCAAAASLRIPVFTHESDFSPGLATRINLRFAQILFTAFKETVRFIPRALQGRVVAVGNPIRPEFFNADPQRGRAYLGASPEDRILLVLGGSLGAQQLNDLVREALPQLTDNFMVAHQTGPAADWDLEAQEQYRPYPFIREEMADVLAAAELVVCRSGAGTIWECAALGKPMILIPLSGSGTRGDQSENAEYLEKHGAAVVLRGNVNAQSLMKAVEVLAVNQVQRNEMAKAARDFAAVDAAMRIAELIGEQFPESQAKATNLEVE